MNLRDQAMIRLYGNTGARLSEVANLRVEDIDWNTDSLVHQGKGSKERRVRISPKTTRAVSRHLGHVPGTPVCERPELRLAAQLAGWLHPYGECSRLGWERCGSRYLSQPPQSWPGIQGITLPQLPGVGALTTTGLSIWVPSSARACPSAFGRS